MFFFSKMKKTSGHTAQGKPQLKFERNPCNKFRDNRCHRRTDGRTDGRMDDGRRTTDDGRRTNFNFMNVSRAKNAVSYNG